MRRQITLEPGESFDVVNNTSKIMIFLVESLDSEYGKKDE